MHRSVYCMRRCSRNFRATAYLSANDMCCFRHWWDFQQNVHLLCSLLLRKCRNLAHVLFQHRQNVIHDGLASVGFSHSCNVAMKSQ